MVTSTPHRAAAGLQVRDFRRPATPDQTGAGRSGCLELTRRFEPEG